jgi:alpha-ribazole phosphatase
MRLYLVRHPQPVVAEKTCYGRTDLTVAPEEQALAVSALLPDLPTRTKVFSSPALRCVGLAERLAEGLDCAAPIYDARLTEMDFGAWEMRGWDDIPRDEVDAWTNDLVGYRPGGGESLMQMAERVRAFHDDVLQLREEHVVVICHAGTIRLLSACERGLSLAEMALYAARSPHKIGYGELVVCDR